MLHPQIHWCPRPLPPLRDLFRKQESARPIETSGIDGKFCPRAILLETLFNREKLKVGYLDLLLDSRATMQLFRGFALLCGDISFAICPRNQVF